MANLTSKAVKEYLKQLDVDVRPSVLISTYIQTIKAVAGVKLDLTVVDAGRFEYRPSTKKVIEAVDGKRTVGRGASVCFVPSDVVTRDINGVKSDTPFDSAIAKMVNRVNNSSGHRYTQSCAALVALASFAVAYQENQKVSIREGGTFTVGIRTMTKVGKRVFDKPRVSYTYSHRAGVK